MGALSGITGLRQAAEGAGPQGNEELGQEAFLSLMIKQLENQDPFAPMESGEFLGQIAQFGTVSGIQGLQDSFGDLASSLTAQQAMRGADLLDRRVLVDADTGRYDATTPLEGAVELPAAAEDVVVEVRDAFGGLVRRIDVGRAASGLTDFAWDGTTASGRAQPPGDYRFEATARIDGRTEEVPVLVRATVRGIELDGGAGLRLDIGAGDPVDVSRLRRID